MLDSPYKHIAKAILMQEQPLSGMTVLDFGQVYNGPYCGFLLAQAGARVIKVESLTPTTTSTHT